MSYSYRKTQSNSDATSNYDIIGKYPVKFIDFFKWILEHDNSFRIEFRATNKCYGGCFGNRLEVRNDSNSSRWYWERKEPEWWFEEISNEHVTKCWANGGYGQMTYYCTFEER